MNNTRQKDTRQKDANWALNINPAGVVNTDNAQLAVLMDIRDELKRLNAVFHCSNALDIPNILRRIDTNTCKPKRKKKAV